MTDFLVMLLLVFLAMFAVDEPEPEPTYLFGNMEVYHVLVLDRWTYEDLGMEPMYDRWCPKCWKTP